MENGNLFNFLANENLIKFGRFGDIKPWRAAGEVHLVETDSRI